MKITWNNKSIKELIPSVEGILSLTNCSLSVDKWGFAHCFDLEEISWDILEGNALIYLMNRTLFHPAGYHMYLEDGRSPGFLIQEEDEFCYSEEEVLLREGILHSLFGERYLRV